MRSLRRHFLYAKVYTYLVNFEADEYTVKVAKTIKEDEELLKTAFKCVMEEKA